RSQPGVSSTSTEAPDENLALNLKLKEEVQSLKTSLDEKNRELDALNDKVKWNLIIWFLAGSGVLLLGLLIGLSMRQKRHYSLLD
ncbi:MAG: peptide-binding protein, partial [Desulfobacteraceae bacterium]|nr:peptide-binding protein [Desulfobacteraceae bacterium]